MNDTSTCEKCEEAPGLVHLTEIIDKVKSEVHLCHKCARDRVVPMTKLTVEDLTPERVDRIREHGDGIRGDQVWNVIDMLCLKVQLLQQDQQDYMGSRAEIQIERDELQAEMARLKRLLPHLVDVVWGEAHEDESVPSSEWAWRMIDRAEATLSGIEVTTRDDVLIQIQGERARWAERLTESQAEAKRLRTFIQGVREFDPRTDVYATELADSCNDVLGFCRCCGQEVCDDA